jgi:predicted phage replisome organizer
MADVKWIKITTDIFDDEKILLIESLPDSYAIITVWFKLLCLAGKQNNSGVFMLGQMPYTDSMLATIFRMKEATVTMALKTFEQFGMVEIIDGVITIPNWEKHQSLDKLEMAREQTRARVAKHREKQKLLAECNVTSNVTVTESNADRIREDKEKDKDKDKEVLPKGNTRKKPSKSKYGEYGNVLLTDNEYENLANTHGIETRDKAIKFLDEYIDEKGYKSKSHNLAIRRWVFEAVERQKETEKKQGSFSTETFYNKAVERSLGGRAAMEREASERMENASAKTAEEDPFLKERAEKLKKLIGG